MNTPDERKRKALLKKLNMLVSRAGFAESELEVLRAKQNAEIQAITEKYAPLIDPHTKRRDEAVNKIAKIVEEQWDFIKAGEPGKTLSLRAGDIIKRASSRVEVTDASAALSWLRRRKLLRRFTTQAEPALSKSKLNEDPKVLSKMPGAELVTAENMTIKPVKAAGTLVRNLHPMRRPISTS